MLFVLEGLDGAGKSTVAEHLRIVLEKGIGNNELWSKKFKGVVVIKFPDRSTQIGRIIDGALKGKCEVPDDLLYFLFAANKFERKEDLEREDYITITERYIPSAHVYNNNEYSLRMHEYLPQADITFFLDLPYTECCRRCDGTEKYEKTLQEFAKRHERYIKYFTSAHKYLCNYKIINVKEDTPVEIVVQILFEHVVTYINSRCFTKPKAPKLPNISEYIGKYIGKKVSMSISVDGQTYYAQGFLTFANSITPEDGNTGYAILNDVFHIPLKYITSIDENYGISMNPFEVVAKPRK